MKVLLDTHVVIAFVERRAADLGAAIGALINSAAHNVSVASLWEIEIKYRIGRLPISVDPAALPGFLAAADFTVLPITPAHVFAPIGPEPPTRDPFDRLLLGVCAAEGLKLATVDRALTNHPLAYAGP